MSHTFLEYACTKIQYQERNTKRIMRKTKLKDNKKTCKIVKKEQW